MLERVNYLQKECYAGVFKAKGVLVDSPFLDFTSGLRETPPVVDDMMLIPK